MHKTDGIEAFQHVDGRCQMARIEDVVIRQKHQKFRFGKCDQAIEISDRTDIALGAHVVNPVVVEGPHDLRCVVVGCVVAHDQAEVRKGLREHALDALPEPPGPVERGDAHRQFHGLGVVLTAT